MSVFICAHSLYCNGQSKLELLVNMGGQFSSNTYAYGHSFQYFIPGQEYKTMNFDLRLGVGIKLERKKMFHFFMCEKSKITQSYNLNGVLSLSVKLNSDKIKVSKSYDTYSLGYSIGQYFFQRNNNKIGYEIGLNYTIIPSSNGRFKQGIPINDTILINDYQINGESAELIVFDNGTFISRPSIQIIYGLRYEIALTSKLNASLRLGIMQGLNNFLQSTVTNTINAQNINNYTFNLDLVNQNSGCITVLTIGYQL